MPETQSTSNTGMMNKLISTKLRKSAAELRQMHSDGAGLDELRTAKEEMLLEVYQMLTLNMGVPTSEFS